MSDETRVDSRSWRDAVDHFSPPRGTAGANNEGEDDNLRKKWELEDERQRTTERVRDEKTEALAAFIESVIAPSFREAIHALPMREFVLAYVGQVLELSSEQMGEPIATRFFGNTTGRKAKELYAQGRSMHEPFFHFAWADGCCQRILNVLVNLLRPSFFSEVAENWQRANVSPDAVVNLVVIRMKEDGSPIVPFAKAMPGASKDVGSKVADHPKTPVRADMTPVSKLMREERDSWAGEGDPNRDVSVHFRDVQQSRIDAQQREGERLEASRKAIAPPRSSVDAQASQRKPPLVRPLR